MKSKIEITNIALPIVILLGAVAALYNYPKTSVTTQDLLTWLPYGLGATALTFAWMFNRRQLIMSVLVCCYSYWLIQHFLQQPLSRHDAIICFSLLCGFIPINLLINQIPENGAATRRAQIFYAAFATQAIIIYVLARIQPALLVEWAFEFFPTRPMGLPIMTSTYGLVVTGFCLSVSLLLFIYRPNTLSMGLLFSLMAAVLPLTFLQQEGISSIFFSASMLIVLISGMRTSHELAYRDELTGLLGRRMLFERLSGVGRHYTIAMVDIDHFKRFNDTYGHDVGDDVLAMVASCLATTGGGAQVFRYGGEEFTVLFKSSDRAHAIEHLDAIRQEIANRPFAIRDKAKRKKSSKENRKKGTKPQKTVKITVSIGVAVKKDKHNNPQEVIKDADKALYRAKRAGRNKVAAVR